ncbi:MAG: hypothetical protein ACYC61_12300 [Isosphaeraceae bacterium]
MATAARNAPDARRTIGSVEGYLALAIVVASFLLPRVDHPSENMAIVSAIGFGIALVLAIDGVRFGKRGGRLAARVVLGYLSLWILVILLASLARWEQIRWYWGH